jgi:hypothetical protein
MRSTFDSQLDFGFQLDLVDHAEKRDDPALTRPVAGPAMGLPAGGGCDSRGPRVPPPHPARPGLHQPTDLARVNGQERNQLHP